MRHGIRATVVAAALIIAIGTAAASDPVPPEESLVDAYPKRDDYSPYANRNFPTNVYWGDTHVHTGMSMDAGAFGARLEPTDAYRFARGEQITSSTGQDVKGWVDGRGERHEKVYDVAWSGDRSPGANGKLPPVGNTVDVENATWTNSIGSPELITAWTDPDFDPKLRAVYYARVLEIPTPRWTAYEAKRFDIEMPSPDVPMTTQERAYTSPIWYTP